MGRTRMRPLDLKSMDKEALIVLFVDASEKLEKKTKAHKEALKKLRFFRNRTTRLAAIVKYQGKRIVQLYGSVGEATTKITTK